MPRIGVVGTLGGWSTEVLADAVAARTGERLIIDMEKVCTDLSSGKAWYNGIDLSELDALLIKKIGASYSPDLLDRLEQLRFLNERGLMMFSAPEKIMRVLDRSSCTVTLSLAEIPMPRTTMTESLDCALRTVKAYGRAVFKPLYSTKARGMVVIEDGPGAADAVKKFKNEFRIMYIQKMIDHRGMDLGVVFMGGEYLTTYARCGDGTSWNTTTRDGGKYKAFVPDQDIIDIAQKAQKCFGLDFTCVDVALTSDGPVVFEVSAFGGFKGIKVASNMDAASLYADYAVKKLKECQEASYYRA